VSRTLGPTELKRLHRQWRRRTEGRVALVLEDVQNPFNVGSLVRSAAALGVDHVWAVGATPPPTGPKVSKTAMGTERYLTWTAVDDIAEAVDQAHADGYQVVGVELAEGAAPLHDLDLAGDVALVLGHEDRGLSRVALAACDAVGFIPLVGKVGSLNVATATGMALYEVRRQGWAAGPAQPA
jgi:tRNA (guanosine-2'-O-)-methyltransferase